MRKFFISLIPDKSDVLLVIGMGTLFYGMYQIYIPAAYITIGVLTIVIAALPFFAPVNKG